MKTPVPIKTLHLLAIVLSTVSCIACNEKRPHSDTSESVAQVTIGTLLKEMTDRDAAARYPEPEYTSASFSSYDRASVSKEQGWFANGDYNWFLGHENVSDREEFILFDADGPGAVTRWWMTFARSGGSGCLRVYIDNAEEPVIAATPFQIISGDKVSVEPLAGSVSKLTVPAQRGHTLFYPIPYSRHCRITYCSSNIKADGDKHVTGDGSIYYNIEYRTYSPGTTVESYSEENAAKYSALEKAAAMALGNPEPVPASSQTDLECNLDAGHDNTLETSLDCNLDAGQSTELKLKGPAAIREFAMQLDAEDINQALRSTVLEIAFDGESTVFIPVGEFFGVGYKPLYTRMWYVDAAADGLMTARWVMPFRRNAVVKLTNYGDRKVSIHNAHVSVSDWKFDKRSMYFHAMWKYYPRLDTRKDPVTGSPCEHYDLNFVTLDGKGVYMGDSMSLYDLSSAWWGEGDEKVYIDDDTFPSIFGTGTEDYYGYAWCHPNTIVDHPFTSQPSGEGNLAQGYTFNSRHRSLDRIAFSSKLVFDMEIWHWNKSTMDLGVSNYFYMLPGGKVRNVRDASGVTAKPALSPSDLIDISENRIDIEAEYLKMEKMTGGYYEAQSAFREKWSNGIQVFWKRIPVGSEMTLSFDSPYEGTYDLRMLYTFSWDYGSFDILFNGKQLESSRSFNDKNLHTDWTSYGQVEVVKGLNTFKVKAVGKGQGYDLCFFGLDRIILEK